MKWRQEWRLEGRTGTMHLVTIVDRRLLGRARCGLSLTQAKDAHDAGADIRRCNTCRKLEWKDKAREAGQ